MKLYAIYTDEFKVFRTIFEQSLRDDYELILRRCELDIDESQAADIVLQPGEMSLHHVRLIHGSEPNPSDIRRIGFAVRYIPPHVRQNNGPHDTAGLVRGEDPYLNFEHEPRPVADLDEAAVAWHVKSAEMHGQLLYQGTERRPFS